MTCTSLGHRRVLWCCVRGNSCALDLGVLTSFIPVRFHVPVGIDVPGLIIFNARNFDLLKAPLRKIDVASPKIAAERGVSQPE